MQFFLLAQTEGIFTEPAGGVSISILQKMVEQGKIDKMIKLYVMLLVTV